MVRGMTEGFNYDDIWQSFIMAAATDNIPPKNLRVIIQNFIVEEQTKMVIYEAYRTPTCTRSGPNGYREYTELDNGFFALLGSVLGSSTMRMLLDHNTDIGYRTVERVVVFAKNNTEEYDYIIFFEVHMFCSTVFLQGGVESCTRYSLEQTFILLLDLV